MPRRAAVPGRAPGARAVDEADRARAPLLVHAAAGRRAVPRAVTTLRRVARIQRVLLASVDLLDTMAPTDYMTIRTGLGRGSGQESPGFRTMLRLPGELVWPAFAGVPRARGRHAAPDLRAPARSPRAVPAGEGLVDYDQLLQIWRQRHLMLVYRIIGTGTPSLKGKHSDLLAHGMKTAVLPGAVGRARRGVRRVDQRPGGEGQRPRVSRVADARRARNAGARRGADERELCPAPHRDGRGRRRRGRAAHVRGQRTPRSGTPTMRSTCRARAASITGAVARRARRARGARDGVRRHQRARAPTRRGDHPGRPGAAATRTPRSPPVPIEDAGAPLVPLVPVDAGAPDAGAPDAGIADAAP